MDREMNGHRKYIGFNDHFNKRLYKTMSLWNTGGYMFSKENSSDFYGGIFNLTFSPDGSLLTAATENKSILIFDPFNHKLIKHVNKAHRDSVNYIRFLDTRIFATCSDDCSVALWDLRMLKNRLRLFTGHSYWVKNIEYDSSKGLLVTSGYDGCVNVWDINKNDDNSSNSNPTLDHTYQGSQGSQTRVLYLTCIMRMRLSQDSTKMIICTSEGYILIIHDLDLMNLQNDLRGFESDLYRLMQKGHSCGFDFGSWFNRLFTAKRNRIELISDFPPYNQAHSINSLDVHPHNWAILSRNISQDENSEWTCVHDIQDDIKPTELTSLIVPKESLLPNQQQNGCWPGPTIVSSASSSTSEASASSTYGISSSNNTELGSVTQNSPSSSNSIGESFNSNFAMDMNISPVVIISARTLNRRAHATILNPNTSYRQIEPASKTLPKIFKNIPRLTHYISELNVGPGFIKEIEWAPDGRLICSPYDYGLRILSFNENCSEMSDSEPIRGQPKALNVLKTISLHSNYVVTTRFSPTHPMIASGCLGGKVNFYQPIL